MDIPYNKEYIFPLEYTTNERHIFGSTWHNNVLYILTMDKLISTTNLVDYNIVIDDIENIIHSNTKDTTINYRIIYTFLYVEFYKNMIYITNKNIIIKFNVDTKSSSVIKIDAIKNIRYIKMLDYNTCILIDTEYPNSKIKLYIYNIQHNAFCCKVGQYIDDELACVYSNNGFIYLYSSKYKYIFNESLDIINITNFSSVYWDSITNFVLRLNNNYVLIVSYSSYLQLAHIVNNYFEILYDYGKCNLCTVDNMDNIYVFEYENNKYTIKKIQG